MCVTGICLNSLKDSKPKCFSVCNIATVYANDYRRNQKLTLILYIIQDQFQLILMQ